MMAQYAEKTSVPVERSRAEIEGTLQRFGASKFMSGWDPERAYIAWLYDGRAYRIEIKLPVRKDYLHTPSRGLWRSPDEVDNAWEQACRSRWRGLALLVKAKIVAIQNGDATFEKEFLAHAMLPGHQTVAEWLEPQLQALKQTGRMPQNLLMEPPAAKPVEGEVVRTIINHP